jgi:hypothetical protein
MDGEKGSCFIETVYLVNFGHYPKLEHKRFVHQALSRFSRIR